MADDTQYYSLPDDAQGAQEAWVDPEAQSLLQTGQPAPTPQDALRQLLWATQAPQHYPTVLQHPGLLNVPPDPSQALTAFAAPQAQDAPPPPLAPSSLAAPDPATGVTPATALAALSGYDPSARASTPPALAGPQGPPVPPPPRGLPSWAKALAALSALSGGPGAEVADAYLQSGDARDQRQYQQEAQRYRQAQDQQQQQAENGQAQAKLQDALLDRLSGLDEGSQEALVRGLLANPSLLSQYGLTPEQAQAEFYDGQGQFQPVSAADRTTQGQMLNAQNAARARLYGLTPQAQQQLHDSYADKPDQWEQVYGVPYGGFAPGQTQKDVTAAAAQDTRAQAEQAHAQVQRAQAQLMQAQAQGIPARINIARQQLQVAQQREQEAVRRDTLAHQDRQAQDTERVRHDRATEANASANTSLRRENYTSLIKARAAKAIGDATMGGLNLKQVSADMKASRARLDKLQGQYYAAQKDNYNVNAATPDVQARMDALTQQTKQEQSNYDQLNALYGNLLSRAQANGRAALQGMGGAPGALPPMPVTQVVPGVGAVRVPAAPPLPGLAPRGAAPPAAPARLSPQQIHAMSTKALLQRLAQKLR